MLTLSASACSNSESSNPSASQSAVSVTVTSGTSFQSSPVTITFTVSNLAVGLPGTPHLRFSIDGGALHDFYNGPDIDSNNGVLLNGVHDHAVHWASSNSFILFGLTAGPHQVSLLPVDGSNNAVGASTVTNFAVQQPPTADLQLEPVIGGLSFPVGLSLAQDGRILYAERLTGDVRVINPGWALDVSVFCSVSPVEISGEQGLLGLALDPNFLSNQTIYVYYTAPGPQNRISRLVKGAGGCSETPLIWDLPTGTVHNGGILKFGPDGMLYAFVGDTENPSQAQNRSALNGKLLRINPSNGLGLPDNPYYGSDVNQDRVYSYGHRNSYGFTFHPQTNDLWEAENGPADNDEINRIVRGGNYGWPTYGGIVNQPGFIDPILAFNPVIAPTGIIAIPGNSSTYPPVYRNNLLVAVWNDTTIRHVMLTGTNLDRFNGTTVAYAGGQGGLLSLMLGTDGYVYVSNGLFTGTFPYPSSSIFRVIVH